MGRVGRCGQPPQKNKTGRKLPVKCFTCRCVMLARSPMLTDGWCMTARARLFAAGIFRDQVAGSRSISWWITVYERGWYEGFSEFGTDGGPAAKALRPKFNVLSKHVETHTGFEVPHVEMKHLVLGAIVLKGLGSLLFIFGSSLGAYLLLLHQAVASPILYDFYNYDVDKKEFTQLFSKFTQNLAMLGALLFFIGMKNSLPRRSSSSSKKKASKAKAN